MRFMTWLAALGAAGLLWCAPAAAQMTNALPSAATLTGTEQVAMSQGSGCATHVAPCSSVKATLTTIATFANAALDAKLVAIAGLSPSADTCFYFTSSTAVATYTCPSFGRSIVTSSSASAARTTLGAAASGSNADITALTNLTTALPLTEGGTGATSASAARTALGVTATGVDTTYSYRANNLSDLASASTARTNLGVTATGSDTTYNYRANNLSDVASAETARANLGILTLVHPGYVAGRWYWPFVVAQTNNPIAIGAATLRMAPIFVPQRITVSDLFTRLGVASAGGNIQLGIYAMDASTHLATGNVLASTGNISTTTATVVSAALGSSYQFAPGWYWIGVMADNGTVTVQANAGAIVRAGAMIGSTTLANVSSVTSANSIAYQYSVTFGTWPNLTSVSPTEVLTGEVMIGFKVASVP